jgi:ABC-type multidrug transport system ATPase subunit
VFDFDHLTIDDVSRYYGRRRALSHVSLELQKGELVGLLGPNGAGKSTLLGVLATLIRPSSGRIVYGNHSGSRSTSELRERIGFLSHDLQLYEELTARENLEFFAGLYGLDNPSERATRALSRAGLGRRENDVVDSYSRGMRQRLALERALLHDPRLILLDEPFTGLDEMATVALTDRLLGLKRSGCMVLVATHDLDIADEFVDRSVMLRNGKMVKLDGEFGSLRERYRVALVKDN